MQLLYKFKNIFSQKPLFAESVPNTCDNFKTNIDKYLLDKYDSYGFRSHGEYVVVFKLDEAADVLGINEILETKTTKINGKVVLWQNNIGITPSYPKSKYATYMADCVDVVDIVHKFDINNKVSEIDGLKIGKVFESYFSNKTRRELFEGIPFRIDPMAEFWRDLNVLKKYNYTGEAYHYNNRTGELSDKYVFKNGEIISHITELKKCIS